MAIAVADTRSAPLSAGRRLTVSVEGSDGQRQLISGRAAAIAMLIAVEADRVNAIRCGSVTIHWDGDSLRPEWHEHGRRFTVHDA